MDRDNRWDRVAQAYDAMTLGQGRTVGSASEAIDASYAEGVNDEFLAPSIVDGYSGMAVGDGIVMANFRADRAREILQALLDPNFAAFPREKVVSFATALGMVEYSENLNAFLTAIFSSVELTETLGELLAGSGGRQLRIAETEKYAHVTFFFNGGREARFAGEERILIPSPKVATYDLMPEMSADAVTDALLEAIASDDFDLIICNLANGDMVGHSGKLDAAIKAVETLDRCMGRLAEAVHESGGALLITADHGNCEQMLDTQSGQAHTAHTMNKVPLLLVNAPARIGGLSDGSLADIAPTILDLLGLDKPTAMTGHSLLRGLSTSAAAQ
jgi:2,3-bisphosphoglycerate-independent phosphoglycerate mutase